MFDEPQTPKPDRAPTKKDIEAAAIARAKVDEGAGIGGKKRKGRQTQDSPQSSPPVSPRSDTSGISDGATNSGTESLDRAASEGFGGYGFEADTRSNPDLSDPDSDNESISGTPSSPLPLQQPRARKPRRKTRDLGARFAQTAGELLQNQQTADLLQQGADAVLEEAKKQVPADARPLLNWARSLFKKPPSDDAAGITPPVSDREWNDIKPSMRAAAAALNLKFEEQNPNSIRLSNAKGEERFHIEKMDKIRIASKTPTNPFELTKIAKSTGKTSFQLTSIRDAELAAKIYSAMLQEGITLKMSDAIKEQIKAKALEGNDLCKAVYEHFLREDSAPSARTPQASATQPASQQQIPPGSTSNQNASGIGGATPDPTAPVQAAGGGVLDPAQAGDPQATPRGEGKPPESPKQSPRP